MTAFRAVVFGLAGLLIGSFSTVLVHRLPRKESIVAPRSRCPSCGAPIRAADNVPVISWLLLRGRCRSCGSQIPALYPLLELLTAALFVGAALRFEDAFRAALVAAFLGLMPPVAVIDLRHRIIPNRVVYPALVAFGAAVALGDLLGGEVVLVDGLIGLSAYGGTFLLIALLVPAGMGMGDVKLNALTGLVLGSLGLSYVAVAAGMGILLGGVGAVGALIRGAGRKGAIPFGPFLAAGAVLAAFLGPEISGLYLDLLT